MGTFSRGAAAAVAALLACAAVAGVGLAAQTHAAATSITSLKVSGSSTRPVFTIRGHGLALPKPAPAVSPSNQPLCPLTISGNAGYDYGTQFGLLAWAAQPADANVLLYAAGRYRPALNELDCIGIVVLSHTPAKVVFTFGHAYQQYYLTKPRPIRSGDVVEVVLRGARYASVVRF